MRYAVVRDKLPYAFTKFHDTFAEAKTEAERLCMQERATFIILEVVGSVRRENPKPPLVWTWERAIE